MRKDVVKAPRRGGATIKKQRLRFYIGWFLPLLIQFCIFYIYLNFKSILLAFQEYKINANGVGHTVKFIGFDNIKIALQFFFSKRAGDMIVNSLIVYGCQLLIVTTLALFFSYYIAKKYPCSGMFRFMLYLPTIVSSAVMAILYQYVVTDVYSTLAYKLTGTALPGLLDNEATEYGTILFFCLWMGFGGNVMIYTGTMSSIDTSVVESAQLDGVNSLQEFWYIYIPLMYPTLVTFIVTGITGLFSNQMHLYTFYGHNGSKFGTETFGFYFYKMTASTGVSLYKTSTPLASYPELSALGLVITMILCPITMITRKLMVKFGPSVD